jgi:phosphoglycolate phosphatase
MGNESELGVDEGVCGGGAYKKSSGFLKNTEVYLANRLKEYTTAFDKIYAGETEVDFASMKRYRKLPIEVGFARTTDLFQDGAKITVRTLEGDIDLVAKENIYVMIVSAVIDRYSGDKHSILECAKVCVPVNEKIIKARQIFWPQTKMI